MQTNRLAPSPGAKCTSNRSLNVKINRFSITSPSRIAREPCVAPRATSPSDDNGDNTQPPNRSIPNNSQSDLDDRIMSGEFTDSGSTKEKLTRPIRKMLAKDPLGPGRAVAYQLAQIGQGWRRVAATRMPTATGDIREIVGQPVFIPLYKLYLTYGSVFRLNFYAKNFVVISDPQLAKQVLLTNASKYSKGLLAEILEFVMGTGLIPADGEVWKVRRRAVVPALHKKYISAMVDMFADCALHGATMLGKTADENEMQQQQFLESNSSFYKPKSVEMENFFSRLALDIIGKAVFNYEFDSLTTDDPVIQAVYTTLREAEYRSTYPIPYWNIPFLAALVPRQKQNTAALQVISETLDELIARCKKLVEEEDEEFVEEFLSKADPSILHFLVASGDDITSKQMRDDLMTMLIAGHETTAAVLTWTFYCVSDRPDVVAKLREEVDRVLGDRNPTIEDMHGLKYTSRVIAESMRLYPQPPVLIRRALEDDVLKGYEIKAGSDIFISTWNLHRSPELWDRPDQFDPERFPVDSPMPNEVTEDFKYLPFGGGKRKCVGDQFALFEAIVALAMLVRRFDFEMAPDAPEVGMTTGATIHTTNGLHLVPKRRVIVASSAIANDGDDVAHSNNANGAIINTPTAAAKEMAVLAFTDAQEQNPQN